VTQTTWAAPGADVRSLLRPTASPAAAEGPTTVPAWLVASIEREIRPRHDDAMDALRVWALANLGGDRMLGGVCLWRDTDGRPVVQGGAYASDSTANQPAGRLRARLRREGVVAAALLVEAEQAARPRNELLTHWMMSVSRRTRSSVASRARCYPIAGTAAESWPLLGFSA
jgi:hypothetical protein